MTRCRTKFAKFNNMGRGGARPGAGRKKKETATFTVAVSLTAVEFDILKTLSAQQNKSRSLIIRELLQREKM